VDARVRALRVLATLALLAASGRAAAHQGGLSYVDVAVHDDTADVALHAGYTDWLPIVDLDADHDGVLTSADVHAQLRRLGAHVRAWIASPPRDVPAPGSRSMPTSASASAPRG
jgi:hypothetical protein